MCCIQRYLVAGDIRDGREGEMRACFEVKACAVERAINGAVVVVDIAVVQFGIGMGTDVADRVNGATDIEQPDLFTIDDDLLGRPDW